MNRMMATAIYDIRLQFRNGFYYASLFIITLWLLLYWRLPFISTLDLAWLLPGFLVGNVVIYAFYFIAALVLLEKSEGTLEAQVVTPLRVDEYLTAKLLTLSILSLIEALVLALVYFGPGFQPLFLVTGVILTAMMFALAGFLVTLRYDGVNEFIMPSVVYIFILALPLIGYYGLWQSPLFFLHPVQAALIIVEAAFRPVPVWQLLYGYLYSAAAILVAYRLSQRAFLTFVVRQVGVR
jgi:fluoroquinolone transport system permease protein